MADHTRKAGNTEETTFTVKAGSATELSLSDVTSMALYARKQGATTNHVDGATVDVLSVDTEQKSDGTWTNDFSVSFDPVGAAADGGNAFDTGDEGHYKVYTLVTWSDGDTTRPPNEDYRHWLIEENFE